MGYIAAYNIGVRNQLKNKTDEHTLIYLLLERQVNVEGKVGEWMYRPMFS
jgi:hypothetical protein